MIVSRSRDLKQGHVLGVIQHACAQYNKSKADQLMQQSLTCRSSPAVLSQTLLVSFISSRYIGNFLRNFGVEVGGEVGGGVGGAQKQQYRKVCSTRSKNLRLHKQR